MAKTKTDKLICITGPTASGKSDLAMSLSEALDLPIISADSMQIYKGMDIGTAKPGKDAREKIKHFMIDIAEPDEQFNAFMFAERAENILSSTNAIIAGGTGLYFESLLWGLDYPTDENTLEIRKGYWKYAEEHGAHALHTFLRQKDPQKADTIHPNNVKLVIRALEILQTSSFEKKERKNKRDYWLFALDLRREELYRRINARTKKMVDEGLVGEVEELSERFDTSGQAFQAIGYKEIVGYLEGKTTLEQAIELIKQHTRNYAKRQLTFIKRLNPIWLDAEKGTEKLQKEILDIIKNS